MAKFLNTSATNYFLEELIKGAQERLVLISPFLKLNDRIKELLEDKNRLKIDVRIVYGKSELQPQEIEWLKAQSYIPESVTIPPAPSTAPINIPRCLPTAPPIDANDAQSQ